MSSRLDDKIHTMMQQVVDGSPAPPDLPTGPPRAPVRAWRVPNWAVAVGAAVAVFILIGGVVWLIGRGIRTNVVDEPIVATTVPATTTTVSVTTSTADVADPVIPDQWSSVLATTSASTAPPAAICPQGTDPNAPGPVDQARPGEGPQGYQAAVFDTHAGRIVFIDRSGETWTFDVCTNTWQAMDPAFVPATTYAYVSRGQLVYDIDSDRTIAFGPRNVYAYDAASNTWTRRSFPVDRDLGAAWPGAVYDPISGLVLLQFDDGMLVAYDVDTDTWTEIGVTSEPREITSEGQTETSNPPYLVGHVAQADRLAFLRHAVPGHSKLVNPRTGEATDLADPPGAAGLFGPFSYATGGDTAYTNTGDLCRLEPVTFTWECSFTTALGVSPSALVYDPINTRVVAISNTYRTSTSTNVTDNVLAIDSTTGDTVELLATANTRTETDGS